jgi:hypothetical protein
MNPITYKKYNHLFNINLLTFLVTSAVFHTALILCSLFWWTAEPSVRPSRSEDVYKQLEIHSVTPPPLYESESYIDDILSEVDFVPETEEQFLPPLIIIAKDPLIAPGHRTGFPQMINKVDVFSKIISKRMAGWRNW